MRITVRERKHRESPLLVDVVVPLYILILVTLTLRAIGALGVRKFSCFREAALVALAVMFLFTGTTHFTDMKQDYLAMIPDPLPRTFWLIYLTGVLEISGAVGLLVTALRRTASICLAVLLLAMFPANVHASLNEIPFRGQPPTALWLRAFLQAGFVGLLMWVSVIGEHRTGDPGGQACA